METEFVGRFTQAGSGDETIRQRCRPGNFLKRSSAVGEVDSLAVGEVDEEEPGSGDVALFSETLSSSGQFLATILWKTHGGSFDDEFRIIANAELANASYTFPWGNLFSHSTSPTKNNKPKDPLQKTEA